MATDVPEPRKVVLDVDPGIGDALAMAMALYEPRLEILALTATGGAVPAEQATLNVQTIIEQLDPPRWPRIGCAPTDPAQGASRRHLCGSDGLGEADFRCAQLHHRHPSEKVIYDVVQSDPNDVTVITLGPLTNIAAAIARDPKFASKIGHLIMMGGTYSGPGDVTAAAEFNFYCDPVAAQVIFNSPITMTLVPLDVATRLVMTYDQFDQLPKSTSSKGALLQRILPFSFRAHRQHLGVEGIYLQEAVAVVAALHPELFTTVNAHGEVETAGELTKGATIFDRRARPEMQHNMEVAVDVDTAPVMDCIMRGLAAKEE